MDAANHFESPVTYRLIRLEYLVFLGVSLFLFIANWSEIRWLPAIGLFLYIDLIGYLPGAIAYHRSKTKRISKNYYVLYNVMHSLVTQSVVIGLWGLFIGWEWALLAIPIHLFGDRGLFGNFLKPFNVTFEPTPHPAYVRLRQDFVPAGRAVRDEPVTQAHPVAVDRAPV